MGVLDKFLNAMKLNDDYDDDDFLDDDIDEYEEPKPKKHFLKRLEEDDDFDEYGYDESIPARNDRKSKSSRSTQSQQPAPTPKQSRSTKAVSGNSSKISPMRTNNTRRVNQSDMEVCVIKPHSMEDAKEITETLLSDCTVVLNMEGLDMDLAQRIIDFSSGSCYAIDGNLKKISNYIFIITPSNVDISGDFQGILNGAFDVPSLHSGF